MSLNKIKESSNNLNSKSKSETTLDKKIKIISDELAIMKPETLLLNVDPSIEANKIIEQIQEYHSLINNEMIHLVK